jgi:hypothetical protein
MMSWYFYTPVFLMLEDKQELQVHYPDTPRWQHLQLFLHINRSPVDRK